MKFFQLKKISKLKNYYKKFDGINFTLGQTIFKMPKIEKTFFSPMQKQKFNPPEAIPLSDRPGHFFSVRFLTRSASGHVMVSQTGFFSRQRGYTAV